MHQPLVQIPSMDLEKLKEMKMGNHRFLVNVNLGYYPYFSVQLRQRVKYQKVINIIITGEAGNGKSYFGMDLCRILSPKYYSPDDIVFTYIEFLRAVVTSRRGVPIMFDEPSYAMSKKDWYKEVTKALVKTIESFRFKGKPLFIPIINKALLEKDIRSYLLQFHVTVTDRGKAKVYGIYPSQFKDKVYSYEICKLRYDLFDKNLCNKRSCLTCKSLNPDDKSKRCPVFRARYERRKFTTQQARYEEALEESEKKERSKLTLDELQAKSLEYFDKFYDVDKNKVDVEALVWIVKRKILGYDIGNNKAYRLARQITFDHPELFKPKPLINRDTVDKIDIDGKITRAIDQDS
jgi:hypothetical protein